MSLVTRRAFVRRTLLGLVATPLLAACSGSPTASPTSSSGASSPTVIVPSSTGVTAGASGRLRIGYLPITDAAPLLLAHAKGYYQDLGLAVEPPTMFRSWAQIAEAFQARQVDVVHLLMPLAIWMRFNQQVPVKLVAWDHVNGSALTVAEEIEQLEDLAGRRSRCRSGIRFTTCSCSSCLSERACRPSYGVTRQPASEQSSLW